MKVLNDRKLCTFETWVDDCGKLRHFALHQNPGKDLCLYLDGLELTKSVKVQSLSDYKNQQIENDNRLRHALINLVLAVESGKEPNLVEAHEALGV